MKRILGFIGALVVVCVALIAVIIGAAFFLTQDVAAAGDAFMQAIQENRIEDAYAMLGGQALEEVDLDTFSSTFAESGLASWSFNSRNVNNNTGDLSGTAEFADGTYNFGLVLEKVGDTWQIIGYSFERAENSEDE